MIAKLLGAVPEVKVDKPEARGHVQGEAENEAVGQQPCVVYLLRGDGLDVEDPEEGGEWTPDERPHQVDAPCDQILIPVLS